MTSEQILKADMLDILFDGRNKKYGAYQLRIKKEEDHAKALLIVIMMTLAIFVYSFFNGHEIEEFTRNTISGPHDLTPIEPEKSPDLYIPPPKSPDIPLESHIMHIVKENAIEQDEIINSEFTGREAGHNTTDGIPGNDTKFDIGKDPDPGLFKDSRPAFVPEVKEDRGVFTVVEQQPEFPGGESAMYKWISEHLIYPKEAVRNGLTGKVIVQFIIEKNGSITAVSVIRDAVGAGAGPEAKRIIEKMPSWKPGRQNGNNVRVQFTMPISFNLE